VRKGVRGWCILLMLLGFWEFSITMAQAHHFKVLVVMSYARENPWGIAIKEGIEAMLAPTCETQYVYMDAADTFQGSMQKAREAYTFYQEFQPNGVIAAGDNAQQLFVVPYLKDKVATPVIFCGVTGNPEDYTYPASNVSGILERNHTSHSIAFAKILVPSIKTVGFIAKGDPNGYVALEQFQAESETYPAKFVASKFPKTLEEMLYMAEELKNQSDLLFMGTLEGILDENNRSLSEKTIIPILVKAFGKPVISADALQVSAGTLCAVVKTGDEQGEIAANMLLQAMQGTPVSELPITRNYRGERMLNVAVMRALNIKPKPHALRGVELVITTE